MAGGKKRFFKRGSVAGSTILNPFQALPVPYSSRYFYLSSPKPGAMSQKAAEVTHVEWTITAISAQHSAKSILLEIKSIWKLHQLHKLWKIWYQIRHFTRDKLLIAVFRTSLRRSLQNVREVSGKIKMMLPLWFSRPVLTGSHTYAKQPK